TGVSIMRMVEKMDAGAYMMQEAVPIEDHDTTGSLHDKLMHLGSAMIKTALPLLFEGKAEFIEQEEAEVTYAWNVSKEEEKIDLSKSVDEVYNQIRGLIPWPVGYVLIQGKKLKLWSVEKIVKEHALPVGTLVYADAVQIAVTGGMIKVLELQLEGRSKMDAKSFMNGSGKALVDSLVV
ncbi:MAG: methionyl-tRNA formyltransferase, partial [Erysipelotrichaceae bacterium]